MRRLGAGVAAILAAVLLPLGLVSAWIADVVTDTDEYVATVAPLAKDPEVKKAAVDLLARRASDSVDDTVGDIGAGSTLESLIRAGAGAIVDSPAFPAAWRAANRSAHTQLIRVLEGDDAAVLDSRGRVSIGLSTLVNTMTGQLAGSLGVPEDRMPRIDASFALVKADDLRQARTAYQVLEALGFWLPVLWVASLAGALVLSRHRLRLLGRIGIGGAVALLLLRGALGLGVRAAADSSVDEDIANAVWKVVSESLYHSIFVAIIASVLVAVVTIVVGRFRPAR